MAVLVIDFDFQRFKFIYDFLGVIRLTESRTHACFFTLPLDVFVSRPNLRLAYLRKGHSLVLRLPQGFAMHYCAVVFTFRYVRNYIWTKLWYLILVSVV